MTDQEELFISVDQAQELLELVKQGNAPEANKLLAEVCVPNAQQLFDKVGKLTRQLHTSLADFRLDSRVPAIAEHDMPDARERLNSVIEMTDNAANKTMDAIDLGLPIADQLHSRIQAIMPEWNALMSRELKVGQFKVLCRQLNLFLNDSAEDADKLRGLLTEILMAQDFQDLTGQIIRRVITLVTEVEDSLVDMLTLFGNGSEQDVEVIMDESIKNIKAEGPILDAEQREDAVSGQDEVDDLLSSLGF